MAKKKAKKTAMNDYLEQLGISSIVSPPQLTENPETVLYDCLLRCQSTYSAMHLRMVRAKSSPIPTIGQVLGYAMTLTLLRQDMDLDEYAASNEGRPVSEIVAKYEQLEIIGRQLHDLVGCDAFSYLMQGGVQMEPIE